MFFGKDEISEIEGVKIFDADYNFDSKTITLFLAGNSLVTESRQKELQNKINNNFKKWKLLILALIW